MNNAEKAFSDLFHGKTSVPDAARRCKITTEKMKSLFKMYIRLHPIEDWEIEEQPCWPYS
jgi:hypothetical protein